jgi:hypothetical protein
MLELIIVPWAVTPGSVEAVTIPKNDEAQFQAAPKSTYIHTPFTLQMNFFMCTDDLGYHFVKCL